MKIAQYVETFSYVGMFNTMNFASYICLYLISPFMQHPVGNRNIEVETPLLLEDLAPTTSEVTLDLLNCAAVGQAVMVLSPQSCCK